jgi:two-component system OmpR family response regulator
MPRGRAPIIARRSRETAAWNEVATVLPVRVVLVEDSAIIRERLIENVTVPGRIEVVGHAEGETAAIEMLHHGAWDVLVLDLQLREGSGFGVLRALRRDGRPAGARVIVLTSYAASQYRAKSEQLGADYFFDKSRDHHRVLDVLEGIAGGLS